MVTEIRIRLTQNPPILAFVSVTLWGAFVIHDLRILERQDDSIVVLMPRVQGTDGQWSTIAHPICESGRLQIRREVLAAFAKTPAGRARLAREVARRETAVPVARPLGRKAAVPAPAESVAGAVRAEAACGSGAAPAGSIDSRPDEARPGAPRSDGRSSERGRPGEKPRSKALV